MKILIYGNGWIGNILQKYFSEQGFESRISDSKHLELLPLLILEEEIARVDVVINTVAKTNIDWCEKNKEESTIVNVGIAGKLARICTKLSKHYVFFSSACIFQSPNGEINYEDSPANPACHYSETKKQAEEIITATCPDALIIRPRLPVSEVPHPRNTINKILSYSRLHQNQESITVIEDMLPVLKKLIEEKQSGAFNMVNAGTISPAEIADLFDHKYKVFSKKEEEDMMKAKGRAIRVSTIVGSKRMPLLPEIKSQLVALVGFYKSHL